MSENDSINPRQSRDLAMAVVQVLQMWSNNRYRRFLLEEKPGKMTGEWFRWFVGAWKVARTIKDGRQEFVRKYLDEDFREQLLEGGGADIVDAAAEHIQQQGWSSTKRKNGRGSLPISLVSKVSFFLHPEKFVPLDRYAVEGLNRLRRASGSARLKGKSYREYLEAFDEQYAMMEPELVAALKEPWVIALASKLGCPRKALQTIAMRRKLFDNYLMHSGEYMASW